MSSRHRTFKPKARRIAESHLASSRRGARLLAASGGDAEHADRIDRVLDDLTNHAVIPAPPPEAGTAALPFAGSSSKPAEVIRLPRRPYDRDLDELEPIALAAWTPVGLVVWAGIGLGAWLVLAAIAFGLYSLAQL